MRTESEAQPRNDLVDSTVIARWYWDNRKTVAIIFFAFVVGMLIFNFFKPSEFRAEARLLLPLPEGPTAAALIGVPGLSADPLDVVAGVAKSVPALEMVAKQANVQNWREIQERQEVAVSRPESQVIVAFTGPTKAEAMKLAQLNIDALNTIYAELSLSRAGTEAKLLHTGVQSAESDVRVKENELLAYQRNMKTVPSATNTSGLEYVKRLEEVQLNLASIEQKIDAAKKTSLSRAVPAANMPSGIPEIEVWRTKMMDLEYQLKLARNNYGPEAPNVKKLERDIETTQDQLSQAVKRYTGAVEQGVSNDLADLLAQQTVLRWQRDYLGTLSRTAPKEAVEFNRLTNELQLKYQVLTDLKKRYEQARIQSEIDKVRWSVLTPPTPNQFPTNKSKVMAVLTGMFLAGLCSFAVAVRDIRNRRRRETLRLG